MKYRTNKAFELKDIGGELLLLPRGASTVDYNFVTVFNDTGALIYRAMEDFVDAAELAQLLVQTYGIGMEEATADVDAYLAKMLAEDMIEAQ